MKKYFYFFAVVISTIFFFVQCAENSSPVENDQNYFQTNNAQITLFKGGFDQFGYNNGARLFNGLADGVDRVLDGKVWGDPTFANDKLVMKWSGGWDRGKAEGWTKPPYQDAWTTNQWNGRVQNGSGDVWHYKIIWVGAALENSPYWRPGGYSIWGQFEVIMDQGSSMNEHFWYAHAKPNGL
jgi:hypothetical protein